MVYVMGLLFSQCCCWRVEPSNVVLCHRVLSACLTFQRTMAVWSFRTSGTIDPATQHNITWFFMINSSSSAFTSRVEFRKMNQFTVCFSMILPVAYHNSDYWLFGLCLVTGVLAHMLSIALPVGFGFDQGLVILAWRWGLILSSKCSVLYSLFVITSVYFKTPWSPQS